MGELVEVEAAGSHVGGDQQLGRTIAHAKHHPVTLFLAHAAVQGLGSVAATVERLGELVHLGAGAAKHDGRGGCLHIKNAAERGGLVLAHHDVRALFDERRLVAIAWGQANLDLQRLTLVTLGDAVDTGRHGGREQHGLTLGRGGLQDGFDVLGKTHVEHFVGLIKYHDLHIIQRKRAAVDVIDRSPRSGDDHVHPTVQSGELTADGLAAVDRQHAGAQILAVLVHRLGHLHGQLAGRHQHECKWLGARRLVDAVQDGERKRGGLAGTRSCLAQQVVSGHQQRDGFALDRRGFLVAESRENAE